MKKIIKFFKKLIKKIFRKEKPVPEPLEPSQPEEYSLVYSSDTDDFINGFYDFWEVVKRPPASQPAINSWCENAGLRPVLTPATDYEPNIIKLPCEIHNTLSDEDLERLDKYLEQRNMDASDPRVRSKVAAIKSKATNLLSDGKFECFVRYKTGKGTWPAVWFTHYAGGSEPIPGYEGYCAYYEVDVSEYYRSIQNGSNDVTYHFPKSMYKDSNGNKEWFATFRESNLHDSLENVWTKYSCSWDRDRIQVFVGDKLTMEVNNITGKITDKNGNILRTFVPGDPLYFPVDANSRKWQLILSMQFGFNASSALSTYDPDEFPMFMEIKNIRIYKKNYSE